MSVISKGCLELLSQFHQSKIENNLQIYGKKIVEAQKTQGLKENIKVAKKGGNIAKIAREQLEEEIGNSVITKNNKLNYEYVEELQIENNK